MRKRWDFSRTILSRISAARAAMARVFEIALAASVAVAAVVFEVRRLRAFLREFGARWSQVFMSL